MTGGTLRILGQIKAESGPNNGPQRAGPGTNQRCCEGQEAPVFLHEKERIIFTLMPKITALLACTLQLVNVTSATSF